MKIVCLVESNSRLRQYKLRLSRTGRLWLDVRQFEAKDNSMYYMTFSIWNSRSCYAVYYSMPSRVKWLRLRYVAYYFFSFFMYKRRDSDVDFLSHLDLFYIHVFCTHFFIRILLYEELTLVIFIFISYFTFLLSILLLLRWQFYDIGRRQGYGLEF